MLVQAEKFFYTRSGTNFTAMRVFLRTELKLPLTVQKLGVAVSKGVSVKRSEVMGECLVKSCG